LNAGIEQLPGHAAEMLMGRLDGDAWRQGYDPLRLLLASIGSPTAGPILAEFLDQDFIAPIAHALGGKEADERAVIVAAQIIGFALVRVAIASRKKQRARPKQLRQILAQGLGAAIYGAPDSGSYQSEVKRRRRRDL
jgi:hypothetical protein